MVLTLKQFDRKMNKLLLKLQHFMSNVPVVAFTTYLNVIQEKKVHSF